MEEATGAAPVGTTKMTEDECKRLCRLIEEHTMRLLKEGTQACRDWLIALGTHNPDGTLTKEYGGTKTMTKRFKVWGEYGIHPDQKIEHHVSAATKEEAINYFIGIFKEHAEWPRIGRHNVYAYEMVGESVNEDTKVFLTE